MKARLRFHFKGRLLLAMKKKVFPEALGSSVWGLYFWCYYSFSDLILFLKWTKYFFKREY